MVAFQLLPTNFVESERVALLDQFKCARDNYVLMQSVQVCENFTCKLNLKEKKNCASHYRGIIFEKSAKDQKNCSHRNY